MSKSVRFLTLVFILTLTCSALAAPKGLISGGITSQGDGLRPYLYGEVQLTGDLAIGLDVNSFVTTISFWSGVDRGIYAQGSWKHMEFGVPDIAELGVWTALALASDIDVIGWAGLQAVKNDSTLRINVSAEAEVPLDHSLNLVTGGTATLLGEATRAYGWLGLAIRF